MTTRRSFLQRLALTSGAVVLMPAISNCSGAQSVPTTLGDALPSAKPRDWDPVAFNRARGNAGAIPASYLDDINGPDGDTSHLGKHLPYVPSFDAQRIPAGMIAIMWGDPDKGHARHPNAPKSEANNNEGHWYNWIRVSKATDDERDEVQSTYMDWPGIGEDATGAYAVHGDGAIEEDGGKNTIYLAALPGDVRSGDTIRIYAHCLTHGEYVDFLTVP